MTVKLGVEAAVPDADGVYFNHPGWERQSEPAGQTVMSRLRK